MSVKTRTLTDAQLAEFQDRGYIVIKGLLAPEEVQQLIDNFMEMHAGGPIPGCFNPKSPEEAKGDILKLYPRMMHPHRVNDVALRYLLDRRLEGILSDLFGEEPLAAQSMLYFKPSGARGQALHQDNFYLKVEPGTCIAAWVALDPADRENGGLEVVPGTHRMDIFCPEEADTSVSFTRDYVPVPEGLEPCRWIWSLATCSSSTGSWYTAHSRTERRTASAAHSSATTWAAPPSACRPGTAPSLTSTATSSKWTRTEAAARVGRRWRGRTDARSCIGRSRTKSLALRSPNRSPGQTFSAGSPHQLAHRGRSRTAWQVCRAGDSRRAGALQPRLGRLPVRRLGRTRRCR